MCIYFNRKIYEQSSEKYNNNFLFFELYKLPPVTPKMKLLKMDNYEICAKRKTKIKYKNLSDLKVLKRKNYCKFYCFDNFIWCKRTNVLYVFLTIPKDSDNETVIFKIKLPVLLNLINKIFCKRFNLLGVSFIKFLLSLFQNDDVDLIVSKEKNGKFSWMEE